MQELIEKLKKDIEISQSSLSSETNNDRVKQLEAELDNVKKEQEDLLVLLTDQDSKLRHYKKRLKDLGQTVGLPNNVLLLMANE